MLMASSASDFFFGLFEQAFLKFNKEVTTLQKLNSRGADEIKEKLEELYVKPKQCSVNDNVMVNIYWFINSSIFSVKCNVVSPSIFIIIYKIYKSTI